MLFGSGSVAKQNVCSPRLVTAQFLLPGDSIIGNVERSGHLQWEERMWSYRAKSINL